MVKYKGEIGDGNMGFLDVFKKKSTTKQPNTGNYQTTQAPREFAQDTSKEDLQIRVSEDKKYLEIKYYKPRVWQPKANDRKTVDYDTTKLLMEREPYAIAGEQVYNCLISWYLNGGAVMMEFNPQEQYEQILTTLDMQEMMENKDYCKYAMQKLLDRERVMGYLERGISKETPEEKWCGNYVGGVRQRPDGKFEKRFNERVGKVVHSAPYTKNWRDKKIAEKEEKEEKKKQFLHKEIQKKEEELRYLKQRQDEAR